MNFGVTLQEKANRNLGECIEVRELIIALLEILTRYEPQQVLEDFTEEFYRRYGVECVSTSTTTNENCALSLIPR